MSKMQQLVEQALQARTFAYAPYSQFAVGAALLTADGHIFTGCNIENASFGLTNCAERTAVFKAVSSIKPRSKETFTALAVVADGPRPVPPCGACRQVLIEFCEESMPVFLVNTNGEVSKTCVGDLLPGGFGASDLHMEEEK